MTEHTPSTADLVHRAADLVRETLAVHAPARAPWTATTLPPNTHHDCAWWVSTTTDLPAEDGTRSDRTIAEVFWSRADADHIALWHPGVARAVADLLTDDHHEPRADGRGCGWCVDEEWPCADRRARLAVARALTGETDA